MFFSFGRSIKDLKIDENILKEINKYGIDPDDVITVSFQGFE